MTPALPWRRFRAASGIRRVIRRSDPCSEGTKPHCRYGSSGRRLLWFSVAPWLLAIASKADAKEAETERLNAHGLEIGDGVETEQRRHKPVPQQPRWERDQQADQHGRKQKCDYLHEA